jgi:hypothetical protein
MAQSPPTLAARPPVPCDHGLPSAAAARASPPALMIFARRGLPGARGAVSGCRWRYQSLVSLAHGVMIRTRHEPKFTTRAVSTSTPMTRPRPYVSWVT